MIDFIRFNIDEKIQDEINLTYIDENNHIVCGLNNISKVNICIGKNNSGKSRFIRAISKNRNYNFYSFTKMIDKSTFYNIKPRFNTYITTNSLIRDKFDEILENDFNKYSISKLIEDILFIVGEINNGDQDATSTKFKYELFNLIDEFANKDYYYQIYIPTLRGIEKFSNTTEKFRAENDTFKLSLGEREALQSYINQVDCLYMQKVKKCYFLNDRQIESRFSIYTGEDLYDDIQKKLLGKEKDRNLIRDYEHFLSKNFFENKHISLIPNINSKYLFINIDGEEFALHNFGEGIKQLIIITYKMFINKNINTIFFIEEPEINLHPGLQRKLIEILLSEEFEKHQFFITTHSNHLIDMSLDYDNLSIFRFEKQEDKRFKIKYCPKLDQETLYLIGAKASSIYNSNCTIWVEGITDRLYLKKYLELYEEKLFKEKEVDKKIREDIEYSFVEYSGNNIEHWNFFEENEDGTEKINARFLSRNIFLIADNDFPNSETKKERKLKILKEKLGNNFYRLQCREIENLLTENVIKKVVEERENSKVIFCKKFDDSKKECLKAHVGKWIQDNVIREDNNNMHKYTVGQTNALYNKLDFCKKALNNINSFDDLGEEAKELTKKVYEFIINANKD